ncbi:MAG: thymidine phosphorylase [Anaerolineales bacterium]|nr:thymidine phosphorylase [Anaerolineales bacterium]
MRAVDIIIKKRDGLVLSREEISSFVQGFVNNTIPDYQVSAWAMAVLLNGMTPQETADLTMAMIESGDQLDLSDVVDIAVDKHSTGGVGDKTTLVVGPVVAACGVPVGKMSGRGLSFTGGTLDKMESIPGFRSDLSEQEFKDQLKSIGLVLAGQTADLAPADGKMYALRDVTGTVPSIPLIASSVMSKKLAAGTTAIVLDVKTGNGAFMQSVSEAEQLAAEMLSIARLAGRKAVALISDMNQPLGTAVGNALEVKEAIETLKGDGPQDFRDHCIEVAGHMLLLAGRTDSIDSARALVVDSLASGTALEKFRQLVKIQGGDVLVIDNPDLLPFAPIMREVPAPISGYVEQVHAREVGLAALELGAGREKKGDPVDPRVGILIHRKVGDAVQQGDLLFTVHAGSEESCDAAVERLLAAHRIVPEPVKRLPLFYQTMEQ